MLSHNITIAWRNICKYGSQNIISVLGLSASLICFSFCMHFARYLMGMDKHFDNYDRIAEVHPLHPNGNLGGLSPLEGQQILNAPMNMLENRCMVINSSHGILFYEDENGVQVPVRLKRVETDGNFASVFSVRTVAGSWEQAANLPNSIVLSESKARHLFGSVENALGHTFGSMNNHQTIYTVRAVMADMPRNISFFEMGIDALKLNDVNSPRHSEYGYNWQTSIFGLMPDGVEYDDVSRELTNTILPDITHIHGRERTNETLVATRMGESTANNKSIVVAVITTFAILILSVGLLNFLHFLIGSILNRSREYSLRRLFGCRMRDLFGLLFTQTFMLLCATAFVCSYTTRTLIPLIKMPELFADVLFIDTSQMWWQTVEYIGWLLLACMVICLAVCFYIRHITIQQGVTGISSAPRIRRHLGRNLMMGLQFFICWVFVSLTVGFYLQARLTTGTVFSSLSRAEKEQILSIPLDMSKTLMRPDEKQVLANRLKSHAGVKDMMFCDGNMITSASGMEY